jgi:hypothetical protein
MSDEHPFKLDTGPEATLAELPTLTALCGAEGLTGGRMDIRAWPRAGARRART